MGVYGNGNPYGVYAYGTTYGVMGRGGGAPDILPASSGVAGAGATYGVYGSGPTGVYGDGTATYGVYGTGPIGMCGEAAGASPIGYDVSGSGIVGNGGPGVYGITAAAGMIIDGLSDTGVVGNGGAYGVFGFATSGDGVCGRGTSYGVSGYGEGTGNGVYGMGTIGVYGHSTSIDNNDYGVKGDGGFSGGVWGDSTNALGVYGSSTNGVGVKGYSETHEGIYGWSFTDLGDGILGYNSNGKGVDGRSDSGFGIYGEASGSTVDHNIYPYTGVAGTGLNYGGVFQGAIGVVSNGTTLVSFLSNGDGTNFLAQGPGVKYATFTGAHDCLLPKDYSAFKPGVIVCVTGETRLRKDSRDEISLSYTLPTVKLANSPNDKTILGVFVKKFDLDSHWYKGKEQKGFVNAVGEGRVWVCDINGPIEAGDYITTSYAAGYGQKQNDDLVHNYTLGKATENVDWNKVTDTVEYQGKKYKAYLIAAVYTSG